MLMIQTMRHMLTAMAMMLLLAACPTALHSKDYAPLCYCDGKPIMLADPCVYKGGDTYYLTGTSTAEKGFEYYTSKDLRNWQYGGMLYEGKGEDYVGATCYWAPEVRMYKGKYYLTFSCYSPKRQGLITCLAVSDRPDGCYKDLYEPWIDMKYSAIDCDIFVDDDGKPYLYYSHNFTKDGVATGEIYAAPLTDDLSGITEEPRLVLSVSQPWERVNWAVNRCNEGPWVIKHKGKYIMTYSANDTGYEHYGIGVAEADNPLGPWKKYDTNPMFTTDLQHGISSPGHNSIVCTDGRALYMAYHRHADPACKKPNWDRVTCIEKLKITRDGKLHMARAQKHHGQ